MIVIIVAPGAGLLGALGAPLLAILGYAIIVGSLKTLQQSLDSADPKYLLVKVLLFVLPAIGSVFLRA